MNIGRMDRLIAVYKYHAPTGTGFGPTYAFSHDAWMAKKSLRADEKYSPQASQRYEDVAVRFTAYPIDDLQTVDILKDEQGRFWDIKAIVEIGYGDGVEIDATLAPNAPEIVTPVDPSPPSDGYAYRITAGENPTWRGYLEYTIGSIDNEPIGGASILSTISFRSKPGEGGIEITGSTELLEPLLAGKNVYIDGVKIDGDGWSFEPSHALWWVETGFPVFVKDAEYLIELKPV